MDVSGVKVIDEDGVLSRSVMIKAKNIIMKERIWINRVISEMSQMERSRCILNRYVERFTVEMCPMRYESIGRHPRDKLWRTMLSRHAKAGYMVRSV